MLYDQVLARRILGELKTAQQLVPRLSGAIENENTSGIKEVHSDLKALLDSLFATGRTIAEESAAFKLDIGCESLLDSLERLMSFVESDREKAPHKIEFELIPMLESVYLVFYFFGCVYPDPDKMEHYYEHEKKLLAGNKYIEESERTGKYKYDATISVTGYNKLAYTKLCVESILKTVPPDLNYELILVNHGSTDGTKEYFESVNPTKQLDIKINGAGHATVNRIIEGKYLIHFSNDIIATPNAIANMLRCAEAEPKLGFGVPTTSNITNLQPIPARFSNPKGMLRFAKKNNLQNPYRHEQRVCLTNPVTFLNSSNFFEMGHMAHYYYDVTDPSFSAPDRFISMFSRRRGYKNILAKDAFCYHFGSITISEINNANKNFKQDHHNARSMLFSTFGIDIGNTHRYHDATLISIVKLLPSKQIKILGINSGLGSNPLKIKELYKEKKHNPNAFVYNVTANEDSLDDLRAVSDYVRHIASLDHIFNADDSFPKKFHHIIFEGSTRLVSDYIALLRKSMEYLEDGGTVYATLHGRLMPQLHKAFPGSKSKQNWVRIIKQ